MRACTTVNDAERRARIARRALAGSRTTAGPLPFRSSRPARWETNEQRRRRLRDELLLAGDDPSTWTIAAAIEHRVDRHLSAALVDPDVVDQELDGARAR
jgi:predicted nucleic acid-binding protein